MELKTTVPDGIIFYVADELHTDFIALLIKDGRVRRQDSSTVRETRGGRKGQDR